MGYPLTPFAEVWRDANTVRIIDWVADPILIKPPMGVAQKLSAS